ncbi:Dynamin-like GTPase that mediates homotypic ER fusion [Yamadazyma tenuis]|uniref:GB1/RHD3-type G domain-containing protein n=1 Tax=Candida tenuis (strain ATCC 10573 / BCRC 21748 / CBS 615 / JCM 9827 / NBRC 10315 / NRRL Y-1498 / VKM Y-70) TaxID=590646 RepID=G3B221_CANTC|nr:uncharacterized protein CANTEDRAFT_104397 [Yamadazyma tenuis ATCC 10573]EGV64587.1 hypothetical protein CANTEDRAFT_104397 [Yamadazyma tenuis ATCC 10573]WEJ97353.1 Dynamin-like GTPase that mediates homotypic ER fusion [Yamadazyma tenuis]
MSDTHRELQSRERSPTLPEPDLAASPSNSSHSSDSSFVPIDKQHLVDAIQVINEDKQFNDDLIQYIEKTVSLASIGENYHIISVFGSQSTGKSTLLNKLFNTNFDVMDESRRQQTTKGIWLAYCPMINSNKRLGKGNVENVFVMDVEGTDGRERGEDQDFERKSALFALSTSEILIINIWETQIGLYQGANMGLLKTVFEVNLSLFGKNKVSNKSDNHKVLLLFVIRDHVGVTPVENLASTVTQDLIKMWDSLNKPSEVETLKFDEFFDVQFHALGHKILQEDKFHDDIKLLGDKFVDSSSEDYLWKPNYHHDLPIDGWTMYASNCWEQIDSNKDLDLPTQQILVAKFKCDEIVNNLYEEFLVKYNELLNKESTKEFSHVDQVDFKEIGLLMRDLKSDYLEQFDLMASKYNSSVYEQKRHLLGEKIIGEYKELFSTYNKKLSNLILKEFKRELEKDLDGIENFIDKVNRLKLNTVSKLNDNLVLISIGEINFDDSTGTFIEELNDLISKQQVIELNAVITRLVKKLGTQLNKFIVFEVNSIGPESWDKIHNKFLDLIKASLSSYATRNGDYEFHLGISKETTNESITKFKFKSWCRFYQLIKKNLSKDNILNILKNRFEDTFRYDENGIPKLYNNEFELDANFNKAKSESLSLISFLTIVKLSDDSEILPEYDIFKEDLRKKYDEPVNFGDEDDEDPELDSNKFSHIISEIEKAEVLKKFKKEIDAKYIETKRSIVQHVTQIPYYIYIIIVVLGWNEFLAIIRSPVFFMLALLLGGGTYILYQLNLIKPAIQVGQRMVEEALTLGKQKLKELLLDDHEFHARNLEKMQGKTEEIELDDLTPQKTSPQL